MLPRYCTVLVSILFTMVGDAHHYAGGTITTRCVGNNFHEITLQLFRNCWGDPFQGQTLHFSNDCGVEFTNTGLQPVSVVGASSICPAELPNTTCNGGSLLGYELNTYKTTVYLSPCTGWRINWYICCRNTSLNLNGGPGIYIETTLNNQSGVCNAAPVFINDRVPTLCAGQEVTFDAGATDPEGNELSYALIPARFGSPTPMPLQYNAGYSGAEPYIGLTLNPSTGVITFTPTAAATFVVVVEVTERDAQGAIIGQVMRDLVFNIAACTNQAPAQESGTFIASSGGAEVAGERQLAVCGSEGFCATITISDPDLDQALSITTNLDSILPGATMTLSGTNPLNIELCGANLQVGAHSLWIKATDSGCPVVASRTYHLQVEVTDTQSAGADSAVSVCENAAYTDLFDLLGGSPTVGGQWVDPEGNLTNGIFVPGVSLTGIHTYTVGTPPCTSSAVISVVLRPATDPECLTAGVATYRGQSLSYRPDDSNSHRMWVQAPPMKAVLRVIAADGRLVHEGLFQSMDEVPVAVDIPTEQHGLMAIVLQDASTGEKHTVRMVVP